MVHQEVGGWSTLMLELAQVGPHWVRLAYLRQAKLQYNGLPDTASLSWHRCQEVIHLLQTDWRQEARNVADIEAMKKRGFNKASVERVMTSCFRSAMYERFGWESWATWYTAIGDLPAEIFRLARDYMAERALKLAGRHGEHPEPPLLKRARAASQGPGAPSISEAKRARRHAKSLSARLRQAQKEYSNDRLSRHHLLRTSGKCEALTVTLLRFHSVLLTAGYCRTAMMFGKSGPSSSTQRAPRPDRNTSPEAVHGLPVGVPA
jgi:hypothetical protein